MNTVNGTVLAQMMISGANNLYNKKNIVDDLNVFPVPDGDTGTNMSMTVSALAKTLSEIVTPSVTKIADAMSYATLRGARGNSGVILSQFFRGISKGLKGLDECNIAQFADALALGSDAAYKAVMKPTEGTILTVAREISAAAVSGAKNSDDFKTVIGEAVEQGNKTLAKTPDMLPALKKAGVVDAGGQGWVFFLEGVLAYLQSGKAVESSEKITETPIEKLSAQSAFDSKDIKYMYCTEFIVEKTNSDANVEAFRKSIEKKGDCMLVIDDDDIVKVHIHTNNPGYVLEHAIKMGSMINIKIDNLKYQHQSLITTDENEPSDDAKKDYGFIGVCAGSGMSEIFKDLGTDVIIEGGQTMNPSTDDFIKGINKINAETIFILPNNKNIIMAANQAKEISEKNIIVIPSKSLVQGIAALIAFSDTKDSKANESAMSKAVSKIKTGQITYAVRDANIDGVAIKEGDIMGLADGKIALTGKTAEKVLFGLIDEMCDDDSEFLNIYCGEDVDKKSYDKLLKKLEEKYPDIEIAVKYGGEALYYYIFSIE